MELKPDYKQTKVGVIPDEWGVEPLGDVGEWFSGGTPDTRNDRLWNGEIPWVSAKDMKVSRILDSLLHVTMEAIGNGTRLVPTSSVLIVVRGMILAHTFPVATVTRPTAFNQDVKALVTREGIDSEFILLWLQANSRKVLAIASESTHGTKRIPSADLFSIEVPLPPLPEQRAIATALSDVDALLGALDRLIAKKRDIKQAAMQQLLTGKTRLPGFSGEWELASFGSVFRKMNAKEHQVQTSEYQETGSFPVVDQGKAPVVGFSDRDDKCFHCPNGGVVVFGDHTCIVKFVNFDFVVGADGTQILAAEPSHSAHFHAFQLQHCGIPTTGYNRHYKFLKGRLFLSPPLPEQRAIATVLFDMDTEIDALEARRQKTRALKQGMMQELLTGRTRLV